MAYLKLEELLSDNYLFEDYFLLPEIKLNPTNSYPIDWKSPPSPSIEKYGFFTSDLGNTFEIILEKNPDGLLSTKEIQDLQQKNGPSDIFAIHFRVKGEYGLEGTQRKGGRESVLKVYNTLYKVLMEVTQTTKPGLIAITSVDATNYHPIYLNLVKNNTLPGYTKVNNSVKWEVMGIPVTSIILKSTKNG